LAVICLTLVQLIAQNLPQGIAYQAVAVKDGPYSIAGQNPQAIYWSNKDINVRFTIFEKYPGGSTQYTESHSTKTDDYGVFNLIIGQGSPISGDFTKIPWDLGTAHLQVEIDFDNNGTYKLTSLERFWSVPYAFVTRNSNSTSTDSALNALNGKFNYLKNRDKDTVIGNEGGVSYKSLDSLNKVLVAKLAALKASDKDTVIGNEWQKLTRNKDTLILSDGGGKVALLDEDPKNEIQKLSLSNDTLTLSNGGGSVILNSSNSFTPTPGSFGRIIKETIISKKSPSVVSTSYPLSYCQGTYAFTIWKDSAYYFSAFKTVTDVFKYCVISENINNLGRKLSFVSNLSIATDQYGNLPYQQNYVSNDTKGNLFLLSHQYGLIKFDVVKRKLDCTFQINSSSLLISNYLPKIDFPAASFRMTSDTLIMVGPFIGSQNKHVFKYFLNNDNLIFIDSNMKLPLISKFQMINDSTYIYDLSNSNFISKFNPLKRTIDSLYFPKLCGGISSSIGFVFDQNNFVACFKNSMLAGGKFSSGAYYNKISGNFTESPYFIATDQNSYLFVDEPIYRIDGICYILEQHYAFNNKFQGGYRIITSPVVKYFK
jgi:hypothetical protein